MWKIAESFDFDSLSLTLTQSKTFLYPSVTIHQVLLRITYHAPCVKSDVMSGRRIVRASVSLYSETKTMKP